jgi:hypothetical protein
MPLRLREKIQEVPRRLARVARTLLFAKQPCSRGADAPDRETVGYLLFRQTHICPSQPDGVTVVLTRECSLASIGRLRRVALIFPLFLFCLAAFGQTHPSIQSVSTLFVHVNVVPMDTDHVLSNQSVLVEGGKIKAIATSIPLPAGTRLIDGHGTAFLVPGLADMHVHSDSPEDLAVFLANGVTTVLNMGEASSEFMDKTVPQVNNGEIPGPHVYAAFMVDGTPQYGHFVVKTPDEARWIVRLAKTNGYQFIKVYNNLSAECFYALVEEGRAQHLPIVGHGVTQVGLESQLDAGQMLVAHTEEFLYTVFTKPGMPMTDDAPRLDQIPAAIAFTKRDGAFITADLNTYATIAEQWGKPKVLDEFMRMPTVRYLAPAERIDWLSSGYVKRTGGIDAKLAFLRIFTKSLSGAGIPLVTGTDTPSIPGLVPGFSLHEDMQELRKAGLTNFQVLSAATRTPGEFIQKAVPNAEDFGTVRVGARADLILTKRNPLQELSTLADPSGVMVKGNWYSDAELKTLLQNVAAKYDEAVLPKAAPGQQ